MALGNKTLESFYTAADDDIIEAVTVKNVVLVFQISCAVEDGQHTNKTSHHALQREISRVINIQHT